MAGCTRGGETEGRVSRAKLERVKGGWTKEEVRDFLGEPQDRGRRDRFPLPADCWQDKGRGGEEPPYYLVCSDADRALVTVALREARQ